MEPICKFGNTCKPEFNRKNEKFVLWSVAVNDYKNIIFNDGIFFASVYVVYPFNCSSHELPLAANKIPNDNNHLFFFQLVSLPFPDHISHS